MYITRKENYTMVDREPLQPTAPRYLKGQARSMYEKLVPLLNARGTTSISQSIVEQYCQTWQISRLAFDEIQANGITIDGKKNPAVTTYESAVKNLRGLSNDLGLSPQAMVNLQKLITDSSNSDEDAGLSFKERFDKMEF